MSGFLADNSTYNISTDNEISKILSHFSTDYIIDTINQTIDQQFVYYNRFLPNVVAGYELHFKNLLKNYQDPDDRNNILGVRESTYKEIIQVLCKRYNLTFFDRDELDYYSIAYFLYNFLVKNFASCVVAFFTNFILREKNSLYDALNLNDTKRSKDSSTIYNKKLFKNIKVAIISANLEQVIDYICRFDIPFDAVLNTVSVDKNINKYIESVITPNGDFFRESYCKCLLNEEYKPLFLTEIRLEIQKRSIPEYATVSQIQES